MYSSCRRSHISIVRVVLIRILGRLVPLRLRQLTENTAFAETIIAATLNNELPADLNVLPQVAVQTVTPPVVPPCMASTVAANQDVSNANDPDYMPGEDCSIAAAYGVEPEDLATVADTSLLTTYTEAEADEQAALEASESRTQIVAPAGWSTLLSPAGGNIILLISII